jgi:hypothetical protein
MHQRWCGSIFAGSSIDLEIKLSVRLGSCLSGAIVHRSLKSRQGRSCDKAFNRSLLILKFRRKPRY